VFGAGDWRTRTEARPSPPALAPGDRLRFGELAATVAGVDPRSPRLVELELDVDGGSIARALYARGRVVQYAYLAHELPLWAVQNVYAGRPWAFEMPSAGRPLSWELLLALGRRGITLARITHAAGLSSTGDARLDAELPLPERYDVPAETVAAIERARARRGRVIAVGTSVVRALEGAATTGELRAGEGETALRIGPGYAPRVVDGLLTGLHADGESHFELLAAFCPRPLLAAAVAAADRAGFRAHELGDAILIVPAAHNVSGSAPL
jgi:S-adenosylmethionine:tRNA ribosyltransferase-isomerase